MNALRAILSCVFLGGLVTAAFAHPPYGLVADNRGYVYFSDLETVWQLSPNGRLTVFRAGVPDNHVHELALAPDGAIVGDQNRYEPAGQRFFTGIWRRTPSGLEQAVLPLTEKPPLGFGVWQDSQGNRYLTRFVSHKDQRVQLLRRTNSGRLEVLFDEAAGMARLAGASVASEGGIAFTTDGAVLFAAGDTLRRWRPDGSVTALYRGGSESSIRGLSLEGSGAAIAADQDAKVVVRIEDNGAASIIYREPEAWLPTAAVVVGERLLVLEANADPYDYARRVRLVEVSGGRRRLIFTPSGGPSSQAAPEVRSSATTSLGFFGILLISALGSLVFLIFRGRARCSEP